jgi:hydrogenase maturation protease
VSASRPLVIGLGNPYRQDDGAGIAVLDRLRQARVADLDIVEESGEPASLVERWTGRSLVMLVDAIASGARPGTVQRMDCGAAAWHATGNLSAMSSHGLGVAEAIDLGRALDRLPARLVAFGIESADLSQGQGLSASVAAAVGSVVEAIVSEARAVRGPQR